MKQTFIMIKPDGFHRNLILKAELSIEEKHYEDLAGKRYFPALVWDITSGPVVAVVWEGDNVIMECRKIIGASDPSKWEPGTVRADYAIEIGRNLIHGSDSIKSAWKEITLWFPGGLCG